MRVADCRAHPGGISAPIPAHSVTQRESRADRGGYALSRRLLPHRIAQCARRRHHRVAESYHPARRRGALGVDLSDLDPARRLRRIVDAAALSQDEPERLAKLHFVRVVQRHLPWPRIAIAAPLQPQAHRLAYARGDGGLHAGERILRPHRVADRRGRRDDEVARAVIAPAVQGDYLVTPEHLRRERRLVFVGDDRWAGTPEPDVASGGEWGDDDVPFDYEYDSEY